MSNSEQPGTPPAPGGGKPRAWLSKPVLLGVVASVVLVAGVAIAGYLFSKKRKSAEPPDPPTTKGFVLPPAAVSGDISKLVSPPAGGGDATADIQAVLTRFRTQSQQIIEARRTNLARADDKDMNEQIEELYDKNLDVGGNLPFLCSNELVAAADKGDFNFDPIMAGQAMRWQLPARLLRDLEYVGKAALVEGRLAQKGGDDARAEKIFRAVLIYGTRLINTHVRVWVQMKGFEVQARAAMCLSELWKASDPDKAKLARGFASAASTAGGNLGTSFGGLCATLNRWHPGNLIFTAKKHGDPAWRVEAALGLGMSKFAKGSKSSGAAIMRTLDALAGDSDPWIAAAGKWSRDLTPDVWQQQVGEAD